MQIGKREFQVSTIFKKGVPKVDDRYGVYQICGRQGSGKNFIAIKFILKQSPELLNKVYTNVHSLKIPNYKIEYFSKINELYTNTDEHCIFLIDEISRKYDKNSKTDTQFYAWLNQSRKRKRIVIMITQEWRELPMWIRRPAKFMISTRPAKLLGWFGIYCSVIGDAENMVFNKDEGEYECPPIKYIYYKRNKCIADMYDTFEAINEL